MTDPQTEARAMPDLPDDDSDFTPDLARKIIELYQAALAAKDAELAKRDERLSRTFDLLSLEQQRAERAEQERDEWIDRCRTSVVAFDEQKARAERAEAELAKRPDWATVNATYEKWKVRAERAEAQLAEITEGSRQEFAANIGPMRAYWLQTDHTRLMAENGNLRALLAEKNKALEPFARNVELIPLGAQDHDRLCDYGSQFNGTPTVGQARAARRALEAQGGENG